MTKRKRTEGQTMIYQKTTQRTKHTETCNPLTTGEGGVWTQIHQEWNPSCRSSNNTSNKSCMRKWLVIMMNETYSWSFMTQIFLNGYPSPK